jgi:copper chaperone CopZ
MSYFSTILPGMTVHACINHVRANVEKSYGRKAAESFFMAASSPTQDAFHQSMGCFAGK